VLTDDQTIEYHTGQIIVSIVMPENTVDTPADTDQLSSVHGAFSQTPTASWSYFGNTESIWRIAPATSNFVYLLLTTRKLLSFPVGIGGNVIRTFDRATPMGFNTWCGPCRREWSRRRLQTLGVMVCAIRIPPTIGQGLVNCKKLFRLRVWSRRVTPIGIRFLRCDTASLQGCAWRPFPMGTLQIDRVAVPV